MNLVKGRFLLPFCFLSLCSTLIRAGHNFLLLPTLSQLFGFRCIVRVGEEGNKKKPAPQSYLEVKALALPETKIRKAVRALWARSVSVLPCFVQICEILTFRQTVSLPIIMPQIYKYFCVCNNSCTFFWQNHQHCYPRAKVEVLIKQGVVLFGTYYRKTKRRNG